MKRALLIAIATFCAEAGRLSDAIRTAEEARVAGLAARRLESYRAWKPWRQE